VSALPGRLHIGGDTFARFTFSCFFACLHRRFFPVPSFSGHIDEHSEEKTPWRGEFSQCVRNDSRRAGRMRLCFTEYLPIGIVPMRGQWERNREAPASCKVSVKTFKVE